MTDPAGFSWGEAGGVFAGIVAVLAVLGKGIAWLINWKDARAESRSRKLQAWHDELEARKAQLDARDHQYQLHIEEELNTIKAQNRALVRAFGVVVGPLREIDPDNPGLKEAHDILAQAFPVETMVPEDMFARLALIKRPPPPA